ncbi:unnamed protein product [Ectocarpus sp. 6 AP-2014]
MASIGLNPGPRDAAGFSERGNFRWVVTHGSGFHHLPELIGQHKLQLPDHLRSWTDAARMCGWEAERLNVGIAAYNAAATGQEGSGGGGGGSGGRHAPRSGSRGAGAATESAGARSRGRKKPTIKHSLPQSGLPGMLKFLGCPKEPDISHRTRRGMNVVESLAQCVVCMVRLGIPIPVTSRITQEWAGGGGYAGCHHDELSIDQPQVVLKVVRYGPDGLPAEGAVAAAGTGPVVRLRPQGVMGGGPLIMNAPNPTTGINGSASGAPTQQQPQKTKKKKNKQGSAHNGVSANGVYAEGPPFVGGPAQHQHQQHQLRPGARPGDGLGGGPQWQNGAPGGGWVGGAAGVGGGRGQPMPHWRQNVPINSLAPDYLDYFVRERERQYYKSAGILPYRRDPSSGEVWVLVGSEIRKNKLVVSCLGGKREDSDAGPEHTAWREFWEESGKVLGDDERANFLTTCFEGRARAMWMQSAKMAVIACELGSPDLVSLPRRFGLGGPGVDKRDTSMIALHWVSATELHNACNKRGGTVVVWGPAVPQQSVAPSPQQQQQQQQQQMNGTGEERPGGLSRRQQKKLQREAGRGGGRGSGGGGGRSGRGGRGGGNGTAASLQLPLHQQQQQQQQVHPMAPQIVPTAVEPYPLLKSLVADQAFQLFFAQLAAAGNSNQRFVPVLNGTA